MASLRVRHFVVVIAVMALGAPPVLASSGAAGAAVPSVQAGPAEHHDTSPALRDIPPAPRPSGQRVIPVRPVRHEAPRADPVVQSSAGPFAPTASANFDGIGNGVAGFSVAYAPPDTNLAVGPSQLVESVNVDLAVMSKSGAFLLGPEPINTLWSGFGGNCQTDNGGDPIVKYDSIANRWLVSQLANTASTSGPWYECVAVSTSGDATGSYNRYAFTYTDFPDYPKISVWPDAYYATFNRFNGSGTAFLGGEVCAYNRAAMLAGAAATQQCFNLSSSFGGLLGADVEGSQLPPAGTPEYLLALGTDNSHLAFWTFHIDWGAPANSALSGATNVAVAPFSEACGGGTCIPQASTQTRLDSLGDRLMYRLAYRNFGDHEALIASHSVAAGSSTGVRWYELRVNHGALAPTAVFQQGTYAPDGNYRWMGSIAMDQSGDIGLGYSVSSSTTRPGMRVTGRLVGDPLGQMSQGETTIFTGAGSQNRGLSRWGDYSSMIVDPADGCTFWYTNEYIPSQGSFNWRTRIASFKFPSCTATNDFSMSASPSSVSAVQGGQTTSAISTAVTSGAAQSVALSLSGQPAGVSGSFNPTSVTAGASSTLTLTVGASTTPGTYPLTVTGTGPSATHTTGVSLTVTQASNSSTPPVAGYTAWYDASDTTSITSSSGFVGKWNDKSGHGYDVTQGTGSKQPVTNADTINGLNVIKFTRSSDQILVRTSVTINQALTVFAVGKLASTSGANMQLLGNRTNAEPTLYVSPTGGKWALYASSESVSGTAPDTNAHQFSAVFNGASSNLWVDATQIITNGNPGSSGRTDIAIGSDGAGNAWDGDIAEIIIYPSVLGATDRQSVESYLKAKWGTP
jgi:hypothetical protein